MPQNSTETPGAYVVPLTLPTNGDPVDGPGFKSFADQVAKRFTHLLGTHKIVDAKVLAFGAFNAQIQVVESGTYTPLTDLQITMEGGGVGDILVVAASLRFADNNGLGDSYTMRARLERAGAVVPGAETQRINPGGSTSTAGTHITLIGGEILGSGFASSDVTAQASKTSSVAGIDVVGPAFLLGLLLRPTPTT
jgi:hypothetical protein